MTERPPSSIDINDLEFTHLSVKRNGKIEATKPNYEIENETKRQLLETRSSILRLPVDTRDLDMKRVQESLNLFNAPEKPMLFLASDQYKSALVRTEYQSAEPGGIYIEGLGLSLIQRNLALEALNGVAITESFAIHEGAHSTHAKTPLQLIRSKGGIWKKPSIRVAPTPRVHGMRQDDVHVPHFGSPFEEGYAELERGLYVREHELVEQFTNGADNLDLFDRSPLPLHYMYKTVSVEAEKKPNLTFTQGAMGATILEILMRQNDVLLSTLRNSRRDIGDVRKAAELIDSIMPGLYMRLQQPSDEDMITTLSEVIKEFGSDI